MRSASGGWFRSSTNSRRDSGHKWKASPTEGEAKANHSQSVRTELGHEKNTCLGFQVCLKTLQASLLLKSIDLLAYCLPFFLPLMLSSCLSLSFCLSFSFMISLLITPPRQRTPRAPCQGRGAGLVAVARLPAVSDMCQGRPRGSQLQLRAALGHQSRDLGRLCDAAAARRRARALDDVSRRPTRTRHLFLVAMHLFLVASLFKNSIQALRACACAPSAPWQFDCFPHDGIAAIDMPITTCSDWTKTRIKKPKTKKNGTRK